LSKKSFFFISFKQLTWFLPNYQLLKILDYQNTHVTYYPSIATNKHLKCVILTTTENGKRFLIFTEIFLLKKLTLTNEALFVYYPDPAIFLMLQRDKK
jgi:hypothetical protein